MDDGPPYLAGAQGCCLCLMSLTPQVDRTGGRPVTDPGNRCQWCLVSQEVIWCCLALMSGKMCGRHLGGIFLCAHERIPRGLGRFSFSKAWRAVSGGEARKLLRSALPTNIRFNGRHFRSTTSGEKYRKKYPVEPMYFCIF